MVQAGIVGAICHESFATYLFLYTEIEKQLVTANKNIKYFLNFVLLLV
jgi:hypothetical protein